MRNQTHKTSPTSQDFQRRAQTRKTDAPAPLSVFAVPNTNLTSKQKFTHFLSSCVLDTITNLFIFRLFCCSFFFDDTEGGTLSKVLQIMLL